MIPINITTEWTSLQAQVAAATPLASASGATIKALQLNAAQLVNDLEAAQYSSAGSLDSWTPPADPAAIATGVYGLFLSAIDEANISQLRGIAGRVASNLDMLPSLWRNPTTQVDAIGRPSLPPPAP